MEGLINRVISTASSAHSTAAGPRPANASLPTLGLHINHMLRAWHESPPSKAPVQQFWSTTKEYTILKVPALELLSHSASNGFVERVFSNAYSALSSKLVKNRAVANRLMLRLNGPRLGLPGYPQRPTPLPEQPHEEDDEGGNRLNRGPRGWRRIR